MVGRTALIAGITTASLAVAAISHVGGTEIQPRVAETGVQSAAAPAEPAPVLTGAGKKSFKMQAEPQTLQIAGTHFTPGLTATIVAPLGTATTFVSGSLVELTPKSFKLTVTLDEPGTYHLEIRTASGVRSNPVLIVVTR